MIFVLEDMTPRIKWFKSHWSGVVFASSPPAAMVLLREFLDSDFELIFLDHDLGGAPYAEGPQGDGLLVARALADEKLHTGTEVIVHSCNVPKAQEMVAVLQGTHKVSHIPFPALRARIAETEK